jgi:hypothetical protein
MCVCVIECSSLAFSDFEKKRKSINREKSIKKMVSFQATSCCFVLLFLVEKPKQTKHTAGNSNYIENCRAQSPIVCLLCECVQLPNFNQVNERKKRERHAAKSRNSFVK